MRKREWPVRLFSDVAFCPICSTARKWGGGRKEGGDGKTRLFFFFGGGEGEVISRSMIVEMFGPPVQLHCQLIGALCIVRWRVGWRGSGVGVGGDAYYLPTRREPITPID